MCWCHREGCQWWEERTTYPVLVSEGGMSMVGRELRTPWGVSVGGRDVRSGVR